MIAFGDNICGHVECQNVDPSTVNKLAGFVKEARQHQFTQSQLNYQFWLSLAALIVGVISLMLSFWAIKRAATGAALLYP